MRRTLKKVRDVISPAGSPEVQRTAKAGLISLLKVAKDAGDTIPGASLIFGGILSVIEGLDKSADNVETLRELETYAQSLTSIFVDLRTLKFSPELQKDVNRFVQELEDCIEELHKKSARGRSRRFLESAYDESDLRALSDRIKSSLAWFQIRVIMRREELHYIQELSALLDSLPLVKNASFDSERLSKPLTCFEGTRVQVLKDIHKWIHIPDNGDGVSVFWMNGIAGVGKSTIAQTVAEDARREGLLGASFFFSRMEAERSSSKRVLPTIAYQLAQLDDTFKLLIGAALKEDRLIGEKILSKQMDVLLVQPLAAIKRQEPVVLVLDALDECDNDGAEELVRLLSILAKKVQFPLRIFITSRPEPHIRTAFERPHTRIVLHDIESSIVQGDISLYMRAKLEEIPVALRLNLPRVWFSEEQFETLVSRAGNLFIYAATVIRFIQHRSPSPLERLEIILGPDTDTDSITAHAHLDNVYTQVLTSALEESPGSGFLQSTIKTYQDLVGTIVVLRDPLPVTSLSRFVGTTTPILDTLSTMNSVISVPSEGTDEAPSIYHPSFPDFVTNSSRCRNSELLIDQPTHERRLAILCLDILNQKLRRDMADIQDPSLSNDEVKGLSDRIKYIFTPELQYACLYWSSHLCTLPEEVEDEELQRLLKDFTSRCLLWWIEAMSLLGCTTTAIFCLKDAHRWEQSRSNHDDRTTSLLHDGHRLILANFEAIRQAALHVYHSALSFSPHNSSIRNSYYHEAKDTVRVVQGVPRQWPSCMNTILGHTGSVRSVAFSPDGSRVASGSFDFTVRLWDASSGEQTTLLRGHTAFVFAVAFSPDGSRLASGSNDRTVRLWDTISGEQFAVLRGHTSYVYSVVFSPDGLRVASGSFDQTVRLWNAASGKQTAELRGHIGAINSVAFSPDGLLVASGSHDHTVRLWNATSGEQNAEFSDHGNSVNSVSFSPDGSSVASASADRTIRLWNTMSGKQTCILASHTDYVCAAVFSPDGLRIASGSDDHTVRLWDATSGNQIAKFSGHTGPVYSVAFSPDGSRVASSSNDNAIRLWDATSDAQAAERSGHIDSISSIAFSPDGLRVASASFDRSVRLWDSMSGEQTRELRGHVDYVRSVAFSPDGLRIASGSDDSTVRIWDMTSGEQIHVLRGHTRSVKSVNFTPDGLSVVSESTIHTILIWDLSHTPPSLLSYPLPSEPKNLLASSSPTAENFRLKDRWLYHLVRPGLNVRICYIPGDYDIFTSTVHFGHRIAFGCRGGQVVILDTSLSPSLRS